MLGSAVSRMASALAVLLLLPAAATALMYDVVDRAKLPPAECTAGCARWTHLIEDGAVLPPMKAGWWESRFEDEKIWPSNQSTIDAQWAGGKPPAGIGSACANPALTSLVAWPPYPREAPGTDASFCFCAKAAKLPKAWGDCRSAPSVPEQINVVLGQDNSVVISFVTLWEPGFGADLAGYTAPAAPRAQFATGSDSGPLGKAATGVTHLYRSPSPDPGNASDPVNRYWAVTARNYSFHFVKLTSLPEGGVVRYRVASGAEPAVWSDTVSFKAPFGPTYTVSGRSGPGETVVDLFGDMGVCECSTSCTACLVGTSTVLLQLIAGTNLVSC